MSNLNARISKLENCTLRKLVPVHELINMPSPKFTPQESEEIQQLLKQAAQEMSNGHP